MATRGKKEVNIEVGKSFEGSVEQKFPQVHESRKDLFFDRPDPLAVNLKKEYRGFWAEDTPDNIRKLGVMGYTLAEEKHFQDAKDVVRTYGDLRLMVCPREIHEEREKRRLLEAGEPNIVKTLKSFAEQEGIELSEREGKLKGYVQGWSPPT